MRWDPEAELLVPLADADEAQRYASAVRRFEFDAYLAPYDLNKWSRWRRLSAFISPAVVDRLAPVRC